MRVGRIGVGQFSDDAQTGLVKVMRDGQVPSRHRCHYIPELDVNDRQVALPFGVARIFNGQLPKLPHSSNQGQWIDLIAFLSVLLLGASLMAFGHMTAGSLATVCAALAGLYAVFKPKRDSGGTPGSGEADDGKPDQPPTPES